MQGVVLAGGQGRRMKAVSAGAPKPLVEVAGRPLLAHVLARLAGLGAREIAVVVGDGGEHLVRTFGEAWNGCPLSWMRQREPLGPAHALGLLEGRVSDPFMVMHGDVIFAPGVRLSPVLERFREGDCDGAVLTERREPAAVTRGAVRVEDGGVILDLREYPDAEARAWGRVAAGFYVFTAGVLRACREIPPSAAGEYELPNALRRLVEGGGRLVAVGLEGDRVNVNTPEDRIRAQRLLEGEGPGR